MLSAIEEPKKTAFKRARETKEPFVNEVPKLLYSVVVNNYGQQKREPEDKPEQEFEMGLPPQPKEYLKYPEYDWL